jgi:hypothetical protein
MRYSRKQKKEKEKEEKNRKGPGGIPFSREAEAAHGPPEVNRIGTHPLTRTR